MSCTFSRLLDIRCILFFTYFYFVYIFEKIPCVSSRFFSELRISLFSILFYNTFCFYPLEPSVLHFSVFFLSFSPPGIDNLSRISRRAHNSPPNCSRHSHRRPPRRLSSNELVLLHHHQTDLRFSALPE